MSYTLSAPPGCLCGPRHVVGRACTFDHKRQLLDRLLWLWEEHPTERLGQLISNAGVDDLFDVEDDALLELLRTRKSR